MSLRKNTHKDPETPQKGQKLTILILLIGGLSLALAAFLYQSKLKKEARPGHVEPFEAKDLVLKKKAGVKNHSILIISVDSVRADHLSSYGYHRKTSPNTDAFFGQCSRFYERAYSAEANSAPSVVSMLSGLYPVQHGVRLLFQKLTPHTPILPDFLSEAGYQSAAVVSSTVLTDEAMGMAERFDQYDDFVSQKEINRPVWQRRARDTTDAALTWLETRRARDKPHLLWVHYVDPHSPYNPPGNEWKDLFTHETPEPVDMTMIHEFQRLPGITDGLTYVDLYDSELAYTDSEVGRLLDVYKNTGLLEDTIVVFTSDHGQTMMERDRYFTHGYHVWESLVRVPLMIRTPDCQEARIGSPVSLVDLTPSLLDMVGFEVPEGRFDGVVLSERGPDDALSLEATLHGMGVQRAMIKGHRKWFAFVHSSGAVKSRLFVDLKVSPGEDKLGEWPEVGGEMLDRWIEADRDPGAISFAIERGSKPKGPKVDPDLAKDPGQ